LTVGAEDGTIDTDGLSVGDVVGFFVLHDLRIFIVSKNETTGRCINIVIVLTGRLKE
jgi:hypothetical protein